MDDDTKSDQLSRGARATSKNARNKFGEKSSSNDAQLEKEGEGKKTSMEVDTGSSNSRGLRSKTEENTAAVREQSERPSRRKRNKKKIEMTICAECKESKRFGYWGEEGEWYCDNCWKTYEENYVEPEDEEQSASNEKVHEKETKSATEGKKDIVVNEETPDHDASEQPEKN